MLTRIAWREGMFLKPHHFQRQDQLVSDAIHFNNELLFPYAFGFLHYRIDESLLNERKLYLSNAEGLLPNGKPFKIPLFRQENLYLEDLKENQIVYLREQKDIKKSIEIECDDIASTMYNPEKIEHFLIDVELTTEISSNDICIPLCRVIQSRFSQFPQLDLNFIPPMLNIAQHRYFFVMMSSIISKLKEKIIMVSNQISNLRYSSFDTVQYPVLVNIMSEFQSIISRPYIRPEEWFCNALICLNQIYLLNRRDPAQILKMSYSHLDGGKCLNEVFQLLINQIELIHNKKIMSVEFKPDENGFLKAAIEEKNSIAVYLVIEFRSDFPLIIMQDEIEKKKSTVQLCPYSALNRIVSQSLSGIPIELVKEHILSLSNRSIVFQIKKDHPLWIECVDKKSVYLNLRDEIFDEALHISIYFISESKNPLPEES